jgi:hypothetical protein
VSDTTERPSTTLPEPPEAVDADEAGTGPLYELLPPPPATRATRMRGSLPPWGEPAILAGATLLGCAYTLVVDPNHSSAYPQCPTKLLFGIDCPLCGATRAVHSLVRFDLGGAIDHNLLFVLILPALLYAFVAWTATRMGRPMRPLPMSSKWVIVPFVVVMIAFTIVRNVPGPLHWMNSSTS